MLFLLALQNTYFGDHFDSYFRIFCICFPLTWPGIWNQIWNLISKDVQSWETSCINPPHPSAWSWVPWEPVCAQIPCSVQRDPCGHVTPYISLMCLLIVWNSFAGGEWCHTRPGQPYFKQELSAESVQVQPFGLFLSGNYFSRHPYSK